MTFFVDFRYMKCLATGMRREAVQEERHRSNGDRESRDGNGDNDESISPGTGDMPIDRILEAETVSENGIFNASGNSTAADQIPPVSDRNAFTLIGDHMTSIY